MGQYGNQPDFGTRAEQIEPYGDSNPPEGEAVGIFIGSAALYIGTGGDLWATVVGGNGGQNSILFKNIPNGTFFPVIVTNVWATNSKVGSNTTCSDIVALY